MTSLLAQKCILNKMLAESEEDTREMLDGFNKAMEANGFPQLTWEGYQESIRQRLEEVERG